LGLILKIYILKKFDFKNFKVSKILQMQLWLILVETSN